MENLSILDTSVEEANLATRYTSFNGQILAITYKDPNCRVYTLNEMTLSWELFLERELPLKNPYLKLCSSSTELAIILQGSDDHLDHIYQLNLESKTLTFIKTTGAMEKYLFLPEHNCC